MAKAARPAEPGPYYEFKLTFAGIKPPIWRRLVVPGSITLRGLHEIIQFVGDWQDDHLHAFTVEGIDYGEPDPYGDLHIKSDADCGGVFGYLDMLGAFADPKHPEHEDAVDWLGEDYDSEAFDIEAINVGLAKVR